MRIMCMLTAFVPGALGCIPDEVSDPTSDSATDDAGMLPDNGAAGLMPPTAIPGILDTFTLRDDGDRLFVLADQSYEVHANSEGIELVVVTQLPPTPAERHPDLLPLSVPAFGIGVHEAWLADPTDAYAHGVLGDTFEASAIKFDISGQVVSISAPAGTVFEDNRIRLVDLDDDGIEELIVIRSASGQGASLVAYRTDGSEFAATEPIGTGFRWLNPVGVGDFDGDGDREVGWVVRPHLDATLTVADIAPGTLLPSASAEDYSNHQNGSPFIRQSLVLDDYLLVPTNNRTALTWLRVNGGLTEVGRIDLGGTLVTDIHRFGTTLVFGIRDGNGNTTLMKSRWATGVG